ncbi:uncharacterized protein [Anabrus simplex]|uniref:uncharacterized protein n=1 Tax=Anabrus simplex TaxID=316456 RepID=UPI0035A2DFE0
MNATFYQVTLNEQRLKAKLKEIQEHMNNETTQIQNLFKQNSLRIVINRHFIELEDCMSQVKNQYEILLRAVINAQSGVIEPRIISPSGLVRSFQSSQSNFPKDVFLPVALSMANTDKILKVSDISIFISRNVLSYVIQTSLVNNVMFIVYKLIPFPTVINKSKTDYMFIETCKEYLTIDSAKQMHQIMNENEIRECKVLPEELRICKQVHPLMFTHASQDTDPIDKIVQGVGVISFFEPCRCFSANAKIVSHTVIQSNTRKNVVPDIAIQYYCCEHLGSSVSLDTLHLDNKLPLVNILTHESDLKYASNTVDEVERSIEKKEKKKSGKMPKNTSQTFYSI